MQHDQVHDGILPDMAYPVRNAAHLLGISETHVYRLLARGDLTAAFTGPVLIEGRELIDFAEQRTIRPPKPGPKPAQPRLLEVPS